MAFAECNRHLYFSAKNEIYERGVGGRRPEWRRIYVHPQPMGPRNSGLRGLTSIQQTVPGTRNVS
jgi:hypothetical protein